MKLIEFPDREFGRDDERYYGRCRHTNDSVGYATLQDMLTDVMIAAIESMSQEEGAPAEIVDLYEAILADPEVLKLTLVLSLHATV